MLRRAGAVKWAAISLAVFLALAGAVGFCRVGPMLSIRRLAGALDRDDTSAIAVSVNFEALQRAVRAQVLAGLDLAERKDLSPLDIDSAIQSNISPDKLSLVIPWRNRKGTLPAPEFFSFNEFRAVFPGSGEFTFCRVGIVDWKVCSMILSREGLLMIVGPKPKQGLGLQRREAWLQVVQIKNAALEYSYAHRRCSEDVELLIADRLLPPERKLDPWGTKYLIRCPAEKGSEVDVSSAGPDQTWGTVDDVAGP